MASIKIKSSTSSSRPSSLGARELGIWNNNLYFGNSSGKPIRLLTENDSTGGGSVTIPKASDTTLGGIKVSGTAGGPYPSFQTLTHTGTGELYIVPPTSKTGTGINLSGTDCFIFDGTFEPLEVVDDDFTELNMQNNRNYYIDGTSFNDIYICPSVNESYPMTISIAVHVIDESTYNITPVDEIGANTNYQQKISQNWWDFSPSQDDWIIYTCKPVESSNGWYFLWDRKIYTAYQ